MEYEHGTRSSFIAGHVQYSGEITVKNVIVDDLGADATTEFPIESLRSTPDLPCYDTASVELKLAMNAKNLIYGGSRERRSMF